MAVDANRAGPIRQPDSRALRILTEMYWSPSGWRNDPEAHVTPEDFSYAFEQGLLFEPRHLTHDEAVEEAIEAQGSVTARQVAMAFAYSLPTRRLDLRSALGSYAATIHLRSHAFTPWAGRGPTCETCGFYEHYDTDLNVLSFERFKFGGVRHHHIDYAAFDLTQLRLWFNDVENVDTAALHQVLQCWRDLPTSARARHAADSVRSLVPSNDAERRSLVEVVGIAGVLQPSTLGSMLDRYVPDIERNDALLTRGDWGYPVCRWMGQDGVNETAVAHWWGAELARLDAAAPRREVDRPEASKVHANTDASSRPKPAARAERRLSVARQRRTVGSIVAIPLGDGRFAFGRLLREPLVEFFGVLGSDAQCEPADLQPGDVIFTIWVMNSAITSGRWMKVGRLALSDEEQLRLHRFSKKDALTGSLTIYSTDPATNVPTERPATVEECSPLERAAVWSAEHVEDRLRDHFAGRPNKWVHSLRVT
jgi:hypothetical protein